MIDVVFFQLTFFSMNLSTTCNYVTDRDDMNNKIKIKIKIYQDLPARLIVQMTFSLVSLVP